MYLCSSSCLWSYEVIKRPTCLQNQFDTSMANTLWYIDTMICCHRNITVQNKNSKKGNVESSLLSYIFVYTFLYKTEFMNQGNISYCCVYFIYSIQVPLWISQQSFKKLLIINWNIYIQVNGKFCWVYQIELLRVFTDFHGYKVKYFTILGYNSFIHISIKYVKLLMSDIQHKQVDNDGYIQLKASSTATLLATPFGLACYMYLSHRQSCYNI